MAIQNFATSNIPPLQSNNRCLLGMSIAQSYSAVLRNILCYSYRRGLLRCSFCLDRAMRRPWIAVRATSTDSRAFSFMTIRLRGVWGILKQTHYGSSHRLFRFIPITVNHNGRNHIRRNPMQQQWTVGRKRRTMVILLLWKKLSQHHSPPSFSWRDVRKSPQITESEQGIIMHR